MPKTGYNEFDPFLNECETYVWEWYIPERKVRFGIPSLNSLWIDDTEKNIKLATMLERVHPDDIQKVLVRHTSPLYKSDKMFEVDIRLNVAAELVPDGQSSGKYEWYGFRGSVVRRDRLGRPTYLRGVAINLDQRYRAQQKLISQKERQLRQARQQSDYCVSIIQEVSSFIRNLAENADALIASDSSQDQETRLIRLNQLKDQVIHMLELTDRVRLYSGDSALGGQSEAQTIALWEHLAELQQVYSLKAGSQLKFYFSNLYDDLKVHLDVKVFDLLLDNVISSQLRLHTSGYASLSYVADTTAGKLHVTLTCAGPTAGSGTNPSAYSESGLGLSVCRLMAKRLWGDIRLEQLDSGKLKYVITLPLDVRKEGHGALDRGENHLSNVSSAGDELDELASESRAEGSSSDTLRPALPQVLIGMSREDNLYRNQHLFDVTFTTTTESLLQSFEQNEPDIVFIDTDLQGTLSVLELLEKLHALSPETPLIVTDDYAQRPLHKQVKQLGARYMLTNPLSLRKVNMMIKRFLK